MALVTIGIPVCNEEKYLRATIDSALAQSFMDVEVIICDNCSTDGSFAIAKECATKDKRIRLVRHPENIGVIENFRACLNLANSKYFAWLGGHDIFCSDYIEAAIKHLEGNSAAVMVYPKDATFIDDKNKVFREGACSDIDTSEISSPVKRMIKIIRNLDYCTNIHGVFRTSIAKQLPFETTIGFDNLQLALTAPLGELHALDMEGIRRREVRVESEFETMIRWEKQGVFRRGRLDPYVALVLVHMKYILRNKNLKIADRVRLCILLPWVFYRTGMVNWRRYLVINHRQ